MVGTSPAMTMKVRRSKPGEERSDAATSVDVRTLMEIASLRSQ
jgi:hypothetical protein